MENSSYFGASRHKLSAFFSLIFRFSSCHHPLLASALAKIIQDEGNRLFVGRDENAIRQLISMISSDNRHVVRQKFLISYYLIQPKIFPLLFLPLLSELFCFLSGWTSMLCSYSSCCWCFRGNAVDEIWHHATHWNSTEIRWPWRANFFVASCGQLSFCIWYCVSKDIDQGFTKVLEIVMCP